VRVALGQRQGEVVEESQSVLVVLRQRTLGSWLGAWRVPKQRAQSRALFTVAAGAALVAAAPRVSGCALERHPGQLTQRTTSTSVGSGMATCCSGPVVSVAGGTGTVCENDSIIKAGFISKNSEYIEDRETRPSERASQPILRGIGLPSNLYELSIRGRQTDGCLKIGGKLPNSDIKSAVAPLRSRQSKDFASSTT